MTSYQLSLYNPFIPQTNADTFSNSADPDETAHVRNSGIKGKIYQSLLFWEKKKKKKKKKTEPITVAVLYL